MMEPNLRDLLSDVFRSDDYFLAGVQRSNIGGFLEFVQCMANWGGRCGREIREFFASLEPCFRQSILMSLLPAKAFDDTYTGTIDAAIDEHLKNLCVELVDSQKLVLRDICINVSRYKNLTAIQARKITYGLADIRARPGLMRQITDRQKGRCIWCGVDLNQGNVRTTLEHVTPKHIGGDHYSGWNWALACESCNLGKKDIFAWPACAEAHDFLSRTAFSRPAMLGLSQRWSVLMRDRQCSKCGKAACDVELIVIRRFITGLAIPANCFVVCAGCVDGSNHDVPAVEWAAGESGRGAP